MSVVSKALGRRSPRRTTHVGVPALAVYTSGQTLEKAPQNCHFCHFSARPARLPGAKARSASRSVRSISDLTRVFLGDQDPSWYRCTESATPISARRSLPRVAQNCTRHALVNDMDPQPIPAPQVTCPCVDLTVTRQSSLLNHAETEHDPLSTRPPHVVGVERMAGKIRFAVKMAVHESVTILEKSRKFLFTSDLRKESDSGIRVASGLTE